MPRIDSHAHVWSLDAVRFPWQVVPPSLGIPSAPSLPEDLLSAMAAADVDGCLAVQPSTYGWDNSYLLHTVEEHPSAFLGIALVDPSDDRASDVLHTLGHRRGVRGVRFHILDDAAAKRFFARAEQLTGAAAAVDLTVTLQIRSPYLAGLPAVFRKVPTARIVIDHMGLVRPSDGEDALRTLLELASFDQVTVKLSGGEVLSEEEYPFRDCQPIAASLYDSFGCGRLMWGSNYPHVLRRCTYAQVAELLSHWLPRLSASELRAIEGGTAARVFRATGLGSMPGPGTG